MTFGDLIAQFGQQIASLWPLRSISDWEQGCLIRAGQVRKLLTSINGIRGTGVHFFIPILDEILVMDASIEVVEGSVQTCETSDGESVAFNLAVRYRIVDVCKVYSTIYEVRDTVISQARASAGELAPTFNAYAATEQESEEGSDFAIELAEAVYRDLHERFTEWGIELQSVALSSCTFCRAYRLISEGAHVSVGGG